MEAGILNLYSTFQGGNGMLSDSQPKWVKIVMLLLMAGLTLALWQAGGQPFARVLAAPTELFFSEYVEGSGNNRALEIFNGTGAAVDLNAYTVELYADSSPTPSQSRLLSGTIANGDVFVLAHSQADAAILAVADLVDDAVTSFNGDDAIVLRKGRVIVDVIGQVAVDPGPGWGSDPASTLNHTLRRKV